jgi:D-amino peptidase
MKVYISVDIEGVACVAAPEEVDMAQGAQYEPFRHQMTAEAMAACRGAWAAGARCVVVKDAHWTGRNLDPHAMQAQEGKELQLIRGWSGHPLAMVQGLDESFDAVVFVGYHAAAGVAGNPLAHTFSGRRFARVELNGRVASEYLLYAHAAASVGVPLVFVSGDEAVCAQAAADIDGLVTVPVHRGGCEQGPDVPPPCASSPAVPGATSTRVPQRGRRLCQVVLPWGAHRLGHDARIEEPRLPGGADLPVVLRAVRA